jgi:threonine synthase
MWRYRELMPLFDGEEPLTLGEGWTPLIHAKRLGGRYGLSRLFIKDESLNPTNSFKARGLSAAVTRAAHLGAKVLSVPSAGNAANAMAAYAARAGIEARVFMPKDVKVPFIRECELYGANITLVDGLITDAGRIAAEQGKPLGWYDVSTLKEPYRIEGKKTMGYEIAEQLGWQVPDVILYPAGGGVGLIGIHKAMKEMRELGWIGDKLPRLVAVQAVGCRPIVDAFEAGHDESRLVEGTHTLAFGINVPKALGDFLVLQGVRESEGTAIAVSDDAILDEVRNLAAVEGAWICPEGAACLAAARELREGGWIGAHEQVVVLNTGTGLKYPETVSVDVPVLPRDGKVPAPA